jgi:ribonuclease BN (tRNA processing enzyme)
MVFVTEMFIKRQFSEKNMGASITFLGTAGDSVVAGKQWRASGGIILSSDGLQFHLDPGPGSLVQAKRTGVNVRAHSCILLSSEEIHLSNDANCIADAMTLSGIDKKGILIASSHVLSNAIVREKQKQFFEKVLIAEPGKRIGINHVEIATLATTTDNVGFFLEFPEFTLCYTATTGYRASIVESYKNADVIILNMTFPSNTECEHDYNREKAIKMLKIVKPKLAILTHFGSKMVKADPLYEAREIQKETEIQTIAASDGLHLAPENYAAKSQQKKLRAVSLE